MLRDCTHYVFQIEYAFSSRSRSSYNKGYGDSEAKL